jgi:DNA-directed RNA polymerase specialized sigma24 family protein
VKPEAVFDQYHQSVYGFAYRLTGRTDLAEDITQECFLSLVRSPDRKSQTRGCWPRCRTGRRGSSWARTGLRTSCPKQ